MKKSLPLLFIALVVIGVAAYFMSSSNSKSTSVKGQTDFVIADTSQIGKIFIATATGNKATLSREENGVWLINGKFPARPDAINTILGTFKNVYIQRPVPKENVSQVSRIMAGGSKKVEVYDLKGEWIKTWYVGQGTMDKKGTYMLLETPEYGKSTAPYIMDKKGFIGMLDTRFFTDENEWRDVIIFKYDELTIKELVVDYPRNPDDSFRIEYKGGNNILLFADKKENPIAEFDTSLVKDYMLNFKLASFNNFQTRLSELQEDSIKMTIPYQILTVEDDKQKRTISLWPKFNLETDSIGNESLQLDNEYIYAATETGELALAQRYVWDKFRAPIGVFLREE